MKPGTQTPPAEGRVAQSVTGQAGQATCSRGTRLCQCGVSSSSAAHMYAQMLAPRVGLAPLRMTIPRGRSGTTTGKLVTGTSA